MKTTRAASARAARSLRSKGPPIAYPTRPSPSPRSASRSVNNIKNNSRPPTPAPAAAPAAAPAPAPAPAPACLASVSRSTSNQKDEHPVLPTPSHYVRKRRLIVEEEGVEDEGAIENVHRSKHRAPASQDPPVERAAPTEQAGTVEHAAVLSQGSHSKARDASVQEDLEVSAESSNPAPPDNVDPSPNQVRDSRPNIDVLPDTTKIILHFRKGEPLGTLRSVKDWPTPTWEHKREDGYYVMMGRIEHQIKRLKLMKPENAGLVWPAPVPYVQPTNHSTQRSYRPVNQEDYEKVLAHAWYSERRRLGNEESVRIRIYVYLNDGNDERSQHIQRAPVRRMEEAGRIIQEAFRYNQMRKQESHSTERVATNIQAQESDQALVPDTPIFRQAIWLGRRFAASVLQRHHAIRPRR